MVDLCSLALCTQGSSWPVNQTGRCKLIMFKAPEVGCEVGYHRGFIFWTLNLRNLLEMGNDLLEAVRLTLNMELLWFVC